MRRLLLLILPVLMIPAFANAEETIILYHQSKIPGPQISKDYYIQESLKRVDPKNPNLLQVKSYTTVTSPEGKTTYRVTYQINCKARKSTMVKYWSSGFGNDNGLMVDGKWTSVDDFAETAALTKKICTKK
jgi:hypothetical protein